MTPLSERVTDVLHHIAAATGGHPRPGQDRMAWLVARAIEDHRAVVVEAETGTGKSRAATLAFLMAGMRTFVSTANRALQDQYANHDLPVVVDELVALGYPRRTVAVLKGRANYPCLAACDAALAGEQQLFDDRSVGSHRKAVARWALKARPGTEWAEAPMRVGIDDRVELSVIPEECLGKRCSFYQQCHAEAARRRAAAADLVLVNHALLTLNAAKGGKLIPVAEGETIGMVVDEAHLLEGFAERAFGNELTFRTAHNGNEHGMLVDLADACHKLGLVDYDRELPADLQLVSKAIRVKTLELLGERLKDRAIALAEREPLYGTAMQALDEVVERAARALARFEERNDRLTDAQALQMKRVEAKLLRAEAVAWCYNAAGDRPSVVTYIERAGRGCKVHGLDINCGPWLEARCWKDPAGRQRPVVFCSATVPNGYTARVGVDEPINHIPSPFDLARRQVMFVADSLPSPSKARPDWEQQAPQVALQFADAALATGSVLVLCTSWLMVTAYERALKQPLLDRHPGCQVFVDSSEAMTADVVADFATADRGVLISAQGAWTGIDLPGKVRCVIVPAVPMPVPGDPVNEARKALHPSGMLPHPIDRATAAAKLAQGFGRLMRSHSDWGVCVCLDQRVMRSNYWGDLQSKLPKGSVLVGDAFRSQVLAWLSSGGPQ